MNERRRIASWDLHASTKPLFVCSKGRGIRSQDSEVPGESQQVTEKVGLEKRRLEPQTKNIIHAVGRLMSR